MARRAQETRSRAAALGVGAEVVSGWGGLTPASRALRQLELVGLGRRRGGILEAPAADRIAGVGRKAGAAHDGRLSAQRLAMLASTCARFL